METNNRQRRLVILGAGESGFGAAVLAKDKGMDVFLSDCGTIASKYRERLETEKIPFEEGHHTESLILSADEIVKSPGIPLDAPTIVAARAKNIPVISEIELAGRYTESKMVCITGSNGKTTTTMLIHHILTHAGIDASLAGNIGMSLAYQVAREPHDVYVVELSSFQLDNMYDFKANIAVLLNITPDHLDRYGYKMENYVNAKFRILQNMTPTDAFIFWKDDPVITEQLRHVATEARMLPFSETPEEGSSSYIDAENELIFNTPVQSMKMPRADLALNGLHNVFNSMAAGLSACLCDVSKEDIREALSDFEGVEHRLEFTADIDGVRWINDSKATNVNSCYYALEAMTTPTVLILGGKDKGNDYSEILPLVKEKVTAIVAMGKDNAKIMEFFGPHVARMADTHSLDDAIAACRGFAQAGDTVLLSPCCASFDLFKSYEDRGRQFKNAVRALTGNK